MYYIIFMARSIRCPNFRKHNSYDVCGRLLGAIDNGQLFLRCTDCGQFFEIIIKDNDNLEMIPLDRSIKINLKTNLRVVE
jgi:hypothetical protein